MTIATPQSTMAITCPSTQRKMKRLSSLQDMSTSSSSSFSSGLPRRRGSISAGNLKTKGPSSMMISVNKSAPIADAMYGYEVPISPSSSRGTALQHASEKRRRYQRRGSKTAFMIRGGGSLKVDDLPMFWKSSLSNYLPKFDPLNGSSTLDDYFTDSTDGTSTTGSMMDSFSSRSSSMRSMRSICSNFEPASPLPYREATMVSNKQTAVTLLASALEVACCIEDEEGDNVCGDQFSHDVSSVGPDALPL